MFYDFVTVWTTLPMDLLDSQIAHWIQKFAKVAKKSFLFKFLCVLLPRRPELTRHDRHDTI